jgi:hypothetical protein
MSSDFSDFKKFHYDQVKGKLRLLKDIFARLNLSKLKERYLSLVDKLNSLDGRITEFKTYIDTIVVPPIVPPEPPPPIYTGYLVITGIQPTLYSNMVNFAITIKNIGLGTSANDSLNTILVGISNYDVTIPSMASNEEYTTNVQHSFDPDGDSRNITCLAEILSNGNNGNASAIGKKDYEPDGKAYVIIHGHNPEGKEIGFLSGVVPVVHIGYWNTSTPSLITQHGERYEISSGLQHVYVDFNGIHIDKGMINFEIGTTTELVFTFPRIEQILNFDINRSVNYNLPWSKILNYDIIEIFDDLKVYDYTPWQIALSTLVILENEAIYNPTINVNGVSQIIASYYINPFGYYMAVAANLTVSGDAPFFANSMSGAHISSTDLPIPAPIIPIDFIVAQQSSFTNWFIQQITSTTYVSGSLIRTSGGYAAGFSIEGPGYHIMQIPAEFEYNKLLFKRSSNLGISLLFNGFASSFYVEDEANVSGNTLMKMSSVPYDLLGTGF